ncbi:MAG: proton-conducting transporter membrane subunit, partial [Candidatus Bathyarchaeia archaeon]
VGPRDIRGIKRVWAFSTISEVGYVSTFLGSAGMLASHGFSYEEALVFGFGGAMLHMYNHGLAKSQLLFDSGVMIKAAHAEDLDLMGCLSTRLPSMRIYFIVGALSLGLMPGTLGFTTLREVVFNSSLPELTRIVTIATAGISLAACLSVWSQVFFTNVEHDLENDLSVPRTMYIPGLVAAAAIVVFGLCFTLNWMGLASFDPALTSALRIVAETTIRPEANS